MAAGQPPLRRSSRHRSNSEVPPSGSEYHESDKSMHDEEPEVDIGGEDEEEEKVVFTKTRSGRTVAQKSYVESSEADDDDVGPSEAGDLFNVGVKFKRTRSTRLQFAEDGDDENEDDVPRQRLRSRKNSFISDDDDGPVDSGGYNTRLRKKSKTRSNGKPSTPRKSVDPRASQAAARALRAQRRHQQDEADIYEPQQHTSPGSIDADGSFDEDAQGDTDVDDLEIAMNDQRPEEEEEPEPETDGKPYSLRQRQKVNYAIPPPLEELSAPLAKSKPAGSRRGGLGTRRAKGPGWSASGAELGRWMGLPGAGDDSDSDVPTRTPRKPFGGLGAFGGGVAGGGGGLLAGDLAAAGTPSNLGRVGDATLADADPLGVNVNVTFDEVGGLDDHINSLKEMTVLPLLYPEVFQQFKVTPPRGVLFHGPPGTGKTLLARALAASCRSNGKQISFFMRKGADALSKWVGEAERQLRLLFEEARNSQPSIIFFDEIDGLAPVRSSKQDQIHASIVSTLLALMDGMDGRGQVVVIGATNRPDAIDPALRRPGRFDREFYFPLPGLEAREKILSIMTRGWKGWGDDEDESKERLNGLAKLTKGYGGADLRALCTEAALNAVQRKYPQIYKSNDRLLLKPDSVRVGLRDFMISIKKIVPSSARSSSSAAMPLPPQFVPLLSETLERVKKVIGRVLPTDKKMTALEEAEYEDYQGEEGALEREMTLQSMEKLRIYRPRIIIHGSAGMGQAYVGAAVLHHLEGYHVQSLELGALMGDSMRTIEAGIVQLFVEAKRHQPSVIYIPSLVGWCAAVSETARSTVRAMLDTLAPTDPILLLAVVDGKFLDLPTDVRSWFGLTKDNRVEIPRPTEEQRVEYFKPLLEDVQRPPNQFADGMPRKKRVLEELPIAPPPEPRKPTDAELAAQEESDGRTIALLKYRLGPILNELKRKFRRFTKRARDEYTYGKFEGDENEPEVIVVQANTLVNGVIDLTSVPLEQVQPTVNGVATGIPAAPNELQVALAPRQPRLHDMDLERMHSDLYRGRYLTPQDFMEDIRKIVQNTHLCREEDPERHHRAEAMYIAAEVSILEFDGPFRLECERMAVRERKRREEYKKSKEEAKEKEKAMNGNGSDTGVAGIRKSARNNGLEPELMITDPVKLERRLKRQRDGGATDSHASEEENGDRDPKRSKMNLYVDENRDPLEIATPPRHPSVRFAPPTIEPMQPLVPHMAPSMNTMQAGPSMQPQQPQHPLHPMHSMYPQDSSRAIQPQPFQPLQGYPPMQGHPSLPPPMHPHHYQSMHHDQEIRDFNQPSQNFYPMSANQPHFGHPSRSSHSPHPMQPTQSMQQSTHELSGVQQRPSNPWQNVSSVEFFDYTISAEQGNGMLVDPPHSTSQPEVPLQPQQPPRSSGFDPSLLNPMSEEPPRNPSPVPVATNPPVIDDDPFLSKPVPQQPMRKSSSPHPSKPSKSPELPREASPMPVVERTPTPLPDFHVDEKLLAQLQSSLRFSTSSLTIEHLEQLRATCLSCVWRNRKEWDRGSLIRELQDLVSDFVAEVAADAASEGDR
ncbi:AAA-domain-containing protein [Marasmius fiardii PR-910]|nr:AAA-domain-containing protein [Marasmius fiardii PR-910]